MNLNIFEGHNAALYNFYTLLILLCLWYRCSTAYRAILTLFCTGKIKRNT